MRRVIVIGAGASGMTAAISAARCGALVTVLEGMEKPGKKLLITGSGRCNLTNLAEPTVNGYCGRTRGFAQGILRQFPVSQTLAFFEEIGLRCYERDGYVYPVTGQAQSVLQVLLLELRRLGVKIKCSEKVCSLKREDAIWNVSTQGWTYEAEAVILAPGSCVREETGSDGSGYALAAACGHTVHTPLPALVPLKIKEKIGAQLAGVRMPAVVRLSAEGETYAEKGELQWTSYGISGIAVFQVSRYVSRALNDGRALTVTLDLLPFAKAEELLAALMRIRDNKTCGELFAGVLPPKAVAPLLRAAGVPASQSAGTLSEKGLSQLLDILKQFPVTPTDTKGFAAAQICTGGVDCGQIDENTLESRLAPGLYLTGEVLDVDGVCGGYNLQWAWSSGWVAGQCSAVKGENG